MEELKYKFGDVVYMRTDLEQSEYLVTGMILRPHGILYLISANGMESTQYDFEISSKRNTLKVLGVNN